MRVLIVDDSVVFRSQIRAALEGHPLIEIVGVVNNGKLALQRLSQVTADLVTLDMEMPEMDGLETTREIRKKKFPVRIIVFSSHTTRGSEAALDALTAGADDFVAKPSGEAVSITNVSDRIKDLLLPKVLQFVDSTSRVLESPVLESKDKKTAASVIPSQGAPYLRKNLGTFFPSVIVIGSSTGGPPALEKVLAGLKTPTRCPILIVQHMPPVFTASLAKRLQQLSGIPAAEGVNNEVLQPNRIYVAPGNFHMTVIKRSNQNVIQLDQNPQRNSVRPAVDSLFESIVRIFGDKTMGFVLTGMGEDGMLGCRAIKEAGGGVMIQDKPSCVVFGMPGAVFQCGAYDELGDLSKINSLIIKMTQ